MNEDIQNHFNSIFQEQELFIIEEARQLSAMILLRVTSANDAMTLETLKKYLFSWMEQVIYMKEDHLVRNCLLTIQDLTCASSSICQELDIHQLLSIWVQIVEKNNKHGQNEEIQSLCLWILYNLSCQVQFLSFLARIEVMTFLRNCIPEKKVRTGTGAIPENNTGNTVSKFTINVVPTTTVTGTSTSSSNDFKLAGFILHNLSCSNLTGNEDLLAPLVNLSAIAILRDISLHREDLQEICALAICNFCIGKVNSTRVLHENGGHVLLNFMSTSFFKAHHYRLFAASLRKLVTPPGNQTVMLEAGVVKTFVHLLKFPDIDAESQRNVLATICLLSKCSKYLVRLLDDGILPILISIAENHARNAGILAYCFEILSNLCAVNFEKYVNRSEINVVACLSKLSEHSMSMKIEDNSHSYYERGNGKPIPNPHLLVSMMRTPSNNIKKNLEVQGTYTAPTRKWIPEANITPKPPTTPLCEEVRLTESSHAIPEPIKKKIQGFLPLRKEKLYRDESNEEQSVSHPSLKSIANTVALSRATSAKKESS
jgi:hypothetical protein